MRVLRDLHGKAAMFQLEMPRLALRVSAAKVSFVCRARTRKR